MNGLTILTIALVLGAAWTLRAYQVDLARERRLTRRLQQALAERDAQIEFYLDELDYAVEVRAAAARHPSALPTNVRVLRALDGAQ